MPAPAEAAGQVLVVLEHREGHVSRMSLEALAAGRQLARSVSGDCAGAILGHSLDTAALAAQAATRLYTLDHPLLAAYTADGYILALQQLIAHLRPAYVVFPHTYRVRDFAPALAARFGEALIPDVIAIHSGPTDGPTFIRQLFQGKLNAEYTHAASAEQTPCFLSIQAGSFSEEIPTDSAAEVAAFEVALAPEQIRTVPGEPFRETAHTVDLAAAPILVSVGRGIGEEANLPLVQALADALGAELAASRPICDAGWLPMERQVGSSGQTVAPKLYLAVGISGAIQHLVGIKGAKAVIAINKDEAAPIFEVADYGIAGDLFEIVPALTQAILAARG